MFSMGSTAFSGMTSATGIYEAVAKKYFPESADSGLITKTAFGGFLGKPVFNQKTKMFDCTMTEQFCFFHVVQYDPISISADQLSSVAYTINHLNKNSDVLLTSITPLQIAKTGCGIIAASSGALWALQKKPTMAPRISFLVFGIGHVLAGRLMNSEVHKIATDGLIQMKNQAPELVDGFKGFFQIHANATRSQTDHVLATFCKYRSKLSDFVYGSITPSEEQVSKILGDF
jgi:hypothetical protein